MKPSKKDLEVPESLLVGIVFSVLSERNNVTGYDLFRLEKDLCVFYQEREICSRISSLVYYCHYYGVTPEKVREYFDSNVDELSDSEILTLMVWEYPDNDPLIKEIDNYLYLLKRIKNPHD